MEFETVRIRFLSNVLGCCHPAILLSWQCDVTTCPLYFKCIHTLGVLLNYSCLVGNLLQTIRMIKLVRLVTRHLHGISAFVPQTSFFRETVGDIAKCQLLSQANSSIKFPLSFAPANANDYSACGVRGVLYSL